MTVTTTDSRISYKGDGASTTFPFPFYFLLGTDLKVYVGGVLLTTGFTVVGAGAASGGYVTITAAPGVGVPILILRDPDTLQQTALPPNDPFPSRASEDALDKLTMLIQRLVDRASRTLQTADTDSSAAPGVIPSASARAGMIMAFDSLGQLIMLPQTAPIGAGDMRMDTFAAGVDFAAGVTTQLTLSRAPGSPANLEIFFDSLFQGPDQWSLNGAVVTFTSPIPTGTVKVFARIGTTLSTQIPPNGSVGDTQIVWSGILNRVVDTIVALRSLDKTKYNRAFAVGYYSPQDGGGGEYVFDPADTTSTDNGGTVIVGADGGRWKLCFGQSVSAMQFGAKRGDLSFDSTSAFNALVLDAIAKGYTADFGSGLFRVSSILIPAGNLHITGSATILGMTSGNYDAVLELRDTVDLQIDGSLIFSAVYNLGYKCGVKVWGNDGIVSLVTIYGVSVTGARKAWIIGDETKTDKQVSELVISNGYTFGCPIACAAYGTQTFVEFNGYQLRSSYGDGAGAWLALDARVVLAVGAHVRQVGGEHLMTELTVGAGVELDPIDGSFANQYGSFEAHGTVIECAAPFAITGNPGVSSPIRGLLSYMGCTGIHTQNLQALIQTDADFQGDIICKGNHFYSTTPRSFANIACSGNANVHCDDTSFGANFPQGLGGISGGIAHFSERVIARVSNLGGATIPAGTSTLKWQSADNTGDLARPTVAYNPTTGALTFNQPVKKARVIGGFFLAGITGTSTILTKFNDGGGPATRGIQFVGTGICANIGDVDAGDVVFIDCNNTGSGIAAGSNAYDFIELIGSN